MKNKTKVFHGLVNYGSQAGLFAKGLRKRNITALSVSYPDKFKRLIDVELLHGGNILQKIVRHGLNWFRRFYWFFSYNIFHFYYGTSLFPYQIDLPIYKIFRKIVIMHYLGNDVQGYKKSVEKYKWTNMPGFIGKQDPIEYDKIIKRRLLYETKYVNQQIVCAPCYSEFVPFSKVLPLAIDLDAYKLYEHPKNKIIEILHAPTHRAFKGTDYIISAVEKLIKEGHSIKLNLVENTTHEQLKYEYIKCDVFIDQIMGGWYGAAAIEAMAIGRPVICSIRKSYFKYIDYGDKIPIINADPDCIYDSIRYIIDNRNILPELGVSSRKFVEEIHELDKLTTQLISNYMNIRI